MVVYTYNTRTRKAEGRGLLDHSYSRLCSECIDSSGNIARACLKIKQTKTIKISKKMGTRENTFAYKNNLY